MSGEDYRGVFWGMLKIADWIYGLVTAPLSLDFTQEKLYSGVKT